MVISGAGKALADGMHWPMVVSSACGRQCRQVPHTFINRSTLGSGAGAGTTTGVGIGATSATEAAATSTGRVLAVATI